MNDLPVSKLYMFFIGAFLSQLGNYLFLLGLIYFPVSEGWSSMQIGLLLSVSHLVPVCALMCWGDLGDRISPRFLIVVAELSTVLLGALLIVTWSIKDDWAKYLFIAIVGLKSMITAIQAPARNKYLKLISTSKNKTKSLSIFLTVVTQGTAFFSALLSWFYFKEKTFEVTILFDLGTFFLNGMIVFILPNLEIEKSEKISFKKRVKEYFSTNKFLSCKDILASMCIAGVSLLMIRICSVNPKLTFILGGMFGFSFIVSGILFSQIKSEKLDIYIWPLYSLSFFLLYFAKTEVLIILLMGAMFTLYALLMHIYIAKWQTDTDKSKIATIFSVRAIFLSLTLGIGELVVGKIGPFISVYNEVLARGAITFFIFILILISRKKYELKLNC